MGNTLPPASTTIYWDRWIDGMLDDWVIDEVHSERARNRTINYHALREQFGIVWVLKELCSRYTAEEWVEETLWGGWEDTGYRIERFIDATAEGMKLEEILGEMGELADIE